jgi:hypothetical protein
MRDTHVNPNDRVPNNSLEPTAQAAAEARHYLADVGYILCSVIYFSTSSEESGYLVHLAPQTPADWRLFTTLSL